MRRSTLVLTAVGISAAAVTGSAFTATNTLPTGPLFAGYDDVTVTGVTVDHVTFNPVVSDATKLQNVVFRATTAPGLDNSAQQAKMTLKDQGGTPIGTYSCVIGAWDAGNGNQLINCDTDVATTDSGTSNPQVAQVVTVAFTVSEKA